MSGRIPRSARVPHTEKGPERCLHCGSTSITRKGTRRKKIEIVQLWRCASCKRVFTPTPATLRNKSKRLYGLSPVKSDKCGHAERMLTAETNRGEPANWARSSRRNLVFGWIPRGIRTMKQQMRFGGEAPRRRTHSRYGM